MILLVKVMRPAQVINHNADGTIVIELPEWHAGDTLMLQSFGHWDESAQTAHDVRSTQILTTGPRGGLKLR